MSESSRSRQRSTSTCTCPPDQLRKATLAASVGSALEYYDFAIYGTASALIFGKLFFPAFGTNQALILSFATYAVGFLARPVGGLFFGMMATSWAANGC